MFWTFSFVLTSMWLMGVVTGYTMGGAVHVLPVFAVLTAILGSFRRRRIGDPDLSRPSGRSS